MPDMKKSQKRHLRELAGQCYEKEMSLALEKLYEDFKKWENEEITVWDLNEKIHEHHNGTARDLWKLYEHLNDPALSVCAALAKGIIKTEDVAENCREFVERKVDVYELRKE